MEQAQAKDNVVIPGNLVFYIDFFDFTNHEATKPNMTMEDIYKHLYPEGLPEREKQIRDRVVKLGNEEKQQVINLVINDYKEVPADVLKYEPDKTLEEYKADLQKILEEGDFYTCQYYNVKHDQWCGWDEVGYYFVKGGWPFTAGTEALYLCICSRGLGSETLIVDEFGTTGLESGTGIVEAMNGWTDEPLEEMVEKNKRGELVVFEYDEGPVLIIPPGYDRKKIYEWILETFNQEESMDDLPEEVQYLCEKDLAGGKLFRDLFEAKNKIRGQHGPFISAVVRAFLQRGQWTSCNAWRNLDAELMNREQINEYLDMTGATIDELQDAKCLVLRTCAEKWKDGSLPTEPCSGC